MKKSFIRSAAFGLILLSVLLSVSGVQAQTGYPPPANTFTPTITNTPIPPQRTATPTETQSIQATTDAAQKSGAPGSTVTFNVALSSKTTQDSTISVTTAGSSWSITAAPNPVAMEGSAGSVQITVAIPASAQSSDKTAFQAVFQGTTTGVTTSLTLTVSVSQTSSSRPLVVIESYYLDQDTIRPGDSFKLFLSVKNNGSLDAHNLIFSFQSNSFAAQETGGVVTLAGLGAGASANVAQKLLVGNDLWGQTSGSLGVKLSYTDAAGTAYNENFTVNLAVLGWSANWKTATPTPTGTTLPRAQLVVSSYKTDIEPLQPGTIFNIDMELKNLGSGDARNISMVIGGAMSSPNAEGTPQPGISGAGADLSVFAPLGSSNIQFLGDMLSGATTRAAQKLIVNVSANPGAYTLKLSFVYTDGRGNRQIDDQIITLLVYQLPQVEVNYYRDPGPISAMQPNVLPIQVVNLGRKLTVLGNMKITAENATLSNNISLVGALDPGNPFPLDVTFVPNAAGPIDLHITINYTDDFNQPRKIEQTMQVNVLEGAPMGGEGQMPGIGPDGKPINPGMGPGVVSGENTGAAVPPVEETFMQKAIRFLKGVIGLDSSVPQPAAPQIVPGDQNPGGPRPQPMPVQPGGKG